MPLTRSAIKKLRKDRKRESKNKAFETKMRDVIKKAGKNRKPENLKTAVSLIDKAVKKNLIHKNKASHLKSRIMKPNKTPQAKEIKPVKSKPSKKTASQTQSAA